MPTRAEFIAEARTWEGVPWRHMGEDRNGIDCGRYIHAVGRKFGLTTLQIGPYPKRPSLRADDGSFAKRFVEYFREAGCVDKRLADLRPADVVILKLDVLPFHCAIFTGGPGNGRILHAYAVRPWKRVCETAFGPELRKPGVWTHCLAVPGLSD